MLLKEVKLRNFISHKDSLLHFDYGINVITGPNGAGKTSILDAISFALFNLHSRGTKDKLINSAAKKAEIAVTFSEAGTNYAVEWTIEKGKAIQGILYTIKNGEKTPISQGGQKTLIPEIEKILGMDKNLFVQSVYIRQGEIENLVTAAPANRKKTISKLLGIDHLEKAWANMREIFREYEQKSDKLSGALERIPELQKKIKQLNQQIEELSRRLTEEKEKLKTTQQNIQTLKTEIERLDMAEKNFRDLIHRKELFENNISNLQATLNEKRKELKEAIKAKKIIEELKDAVEKIPLFQEYVGYIREKERKTIDKESLEKILKRVEQLNSLLSTLKDRYEEYETKQRLLKNLREKRKNYEGSKQSLEKAKKQLETYETEESRKNKELNQEIKTCSEILEQTITVEKLPELEAIVSNIKTKLDELRDQLESEVQECNKSLGELQQRINDLQDKLSKISEADVCPLCGRELTPDHVEKLQKEFEEEKKRIENKIRNIYEKRREADKRRKEVDKKLRKIAAIDPTRIKKLAEELDEIRQKIEKEKNEIKKWQEKADELERIDVEIEELDKRIEELEEDHTDFKAAKRELTQYASKEEIEKRLQPLKSELEQISREMEELENKLGYKPENPEKKLKELLKKRQTYDRNLPIAQKKQTLEQEISQIEGKISKLKSNIEEIQKEIEKLAYDEEEHKKKKEELEKLNQQKQELQKRKRELETRIEDIGNGVSQLQQELTQLFEKEEEKKKIDGFIEILKRIRQAFSKDGLQKVIRARARPLLERFTKESFERFNLEYSDVKIDDDYNISVAGPQGIRTIDQISGGERVALAIALRLAIARVLAGKVETLILDEPTTHLDEERRKELVSIMNSFFREGGRIIPQMIVITHHEELEEVADIVYNVRKIEGCSAVKMAGPVGSTCAEEDIY